MNILFNTSENELLTPKIAAPQVSTGNHSVAQDK